MNSKQIRQSWLDFFESKNHLIVPSKSLIPYNDNSLLFINSGVATLKDYFSGKKNPPSKKLVNSQKAIRTNDIENVGKTARHHTFFEMLGNFSIGDYFKKEAIEFGYEYIFNVLKFDKNKIYFTYFEEDIETKQYWLNLGIAEDHIIKGSKKTNFWDVGNGPCGPNTEIFYDRGTKYSNKGIELLVNDIENDRYIEIWNIVFSQFNNDGNNNYVPLKQKNIDTGAGLERIVSIIQDVPTNFDTDLFMPIIQALEKNSLYKYNMNNYFIKDKTQEKINLHFKVIADHLRAIVNAISDGVKPSNTGRGYVIRRLIRKAYRSGLFLGYINESFLYKFTQIVKDSLVFDINVEEVSSIIKNEEILFSKTIKQGEELLKQEVLKYCDNQIDINSKDKIQKYFLDNKIVFDFSIAFKLFETYGFPIEITKEILEEDFGISLDISKVNIFLKNHAEKSRSNNSKAMKEVLNSLALVEKKVSTFIGYDKTNSISKIEYLLDEENLIFETKNIEDISYVILDKTPFYATAGGQKHDRGFLIQNGNKIIVLDVFKDKYLNNVHKVKGIINNFDPIEAFIDLDIRLGLERNHSSTHLVFHALCEELGSKIEQLGSDNNEERLTFDFPYDIKPTWEQLHNVEKKVNDYIEKDIVRNYLITTIEEAKKMGAVMTIAESEYMDPNKIRIVQFPNVTSDLCGGTHISNTKKIEKFKIISIESKGSNIFRIKALSSNKYINKYLKEQIIKNTEILDNLILKNKGLISSYQFNYELLGSLEEKSKILENLIEKAREDFKRLNKNDHKDLLIKNEKYEIKKFENLNYYFDFNVNNKLIKNLAATLREKNPQALIILISPLNNNKYFLVVASKKYNSIEVAKCLFNNFKGNGGGNSIMSQGSLASKIENEFSLIDLLKENKFF